MRSIRARLLALLLGGLAVVLLAGGAAVHVIARSGLVRQMDEALGARADVLASLVRHERGRLLLDLDDAPARSTRGCWYEIRAGDGAVLRRSYNLGDAALPPAPAAIETLVFGDADLEDGTRVRLAWLTFRPRLDDDDEVDATDADDPEGEPVIAESHDGRTALSLAVAVDREPVDRALATLLGALVVAGVLVAATAGALVTAGVRWGLAPLDRLRRQLGEVDARTISARLEEGDVPAELAPVYRELNRMLDRVEGVLERERSFADAAAHELRTPLSELRATAEVAVRWPDADRAAAALTEVLAIGREMERFVESLLLISRGHASAVDGSVNEAAIAAIVRACVDREAPAIAEKGLAVTVDLDARARLGGSREALEIIIRNLVENAVRYTPPDGSIGIRIDGRDNGHPALLVDNGPVGLGDRDVARLFEPFWRADGSRSSREHVGLGLAVVRQVAAAVGLRVDAELAGDRLRVRVSPRAGRQPRSGQSSLVQ